MAENLNRQRVLKFLEAYYSGDVEGALARCSDDIDLTAPAPIDLLPHMGHRHGKDEVGSTWRTVHSRYSELRYEIRDLVAEGDAVAVNLRAFFKKRSNGRTVQFDIAVFFTLREGRITRMREIMDTFDLVQQVLERDLLTGTADDAAKPN
jgi:ketosteroid isomerase-like protein